MCGAFFPQDDDFGSSDEIKIFKDEGDDDDKDFSALEELQAALLEEKSSLILETEMAIKQECLARIETGKIQDGILKSFPLLSFYRIRYSFSKFDNNKTKNKRCL